MIDIRLKKYIKKNIMSTQAYPVENRRKYIIMNANESPYKLPFQLEENFFLALRNIDLNRYPDFLLSDVINQLNKLFYNEYVNKKILLGNGSDEIISMLFTIFDNVKIIVPEPSFVMYSVLAKLHGHKYIAYTLKEEEDFRLTEHFIKFIEKIDGLKIVILSSPNNPTGIFYDKMIVKQIASQKDTLLILDQAYIDFVSLDIKRDFFSCKILTMDNVIILRTFSKAFSLAGIRAGLVFASNDIIDIFNRVKLPYNVNSLTLTMLSTILHNWNIFCNFVKEKIDIMIKEREKLEKILKNYGIKVYPSQANFIFFRLKDNKFFAFLKKNNILIRDFNNSFFRVSVATPSENNYFIEKIKEYFK